MKKIIGALAVLAFLVGCGCQQDAVNNQEALEMSEASYDCQGENIDAVFNNEGEEQGVQLTFLDRENVSITLPRVEIEMGAQYTDGDIVFWTNEENAHLSMEEEGKGIECIMVVKEETADPAVFDEEGKQVN